MPVLLDARAYDTDKNPDYLRNYARFFAPLVDSPVCLLELGVGTGGSLQLWRDYFPHGCIVGLDANPVRITDAGDRIHTYLGLQQESALLDQIALERAPGGFDIVIDDASHIGWHCRSSFWHLFTRHLKPGGIFVIEDWGTGYWDDWPDGRAHHEVAYERNATEWPSHASGMVGFVKTLVDEVGAGDISCRRSTGWATRAGMIERLEIVPGQVFAVKASRS